MSGQDDLWRYLREPSRGKPAVPFVAEPEAVRLAAIIAAWERHADSFLGPSLLPGAIRAEVRLAEIEGRQAREFTIAQETQRVPPSVSQPPRPQSEPPTIEGEFQRVPDAPPAAPVGPSGIWPYATSGDEDDNGVLTGAPHAEEPPPRTGDELEW